MITKEEYLKAKAIVEEYERIEYEEGQRKADLALEEDEPENWNEEYEECDFCGGNEIRHYRGCIYELGYDHN
jgi:hypothetical protein